jgi:circadian clock protein KaiC
MKALKRVPTHVPGLDDLLGGGLLESGVYFLQGPPGTGKTTLANQVCFGQVRHGGQAVYITLLAESHVRMMQNMLGQSFFDAAAVPSRMSYVSGYRDLESRGLRGVVELLRAEGSRMRAGVAVLDGIVLPLQAGADDTRTLKEFVHELQSLATLQGCIVLMVTSGIGRSSQAEQTMVDGILSLGDERHGMRAERVMEVSKFRGGRTARGRHAYCITDDGLQVYPRLETTLDDAPGQSTGTVSLGFPGLDALLSTHGVPCDSVTLVEGPSGGGKSLLGLQFLSASTAAEPGLWFGFQEPAAALLRAGEGLGLQLSPLVQSGALELRLPPPGDEPLDQLGHLLLHRVAERNVRRVVIDSLAGFADKATFGERGYRFLDALFSRLRRRGVCTLATSDPGALIALGAGDLAAGIPALADQVVRVSPGEQGHDVRLVKSRGQGHAAPAWRLNMTAQGLTIEPARAPE